MRGAGPATATSRPGGCRRERAECVMYSVVCCVCRGGRRHGDEVLEPLRVVEDDGAATRVVNEHVPEGKVWCCIRLEGLLDFATQR